MDKIRGERSGWELEERRGVETEEVKGVDPLEGGDPKKTESGNLALSGLWTESGLPSTDWVESSGEVVLENIGRKNWTSWTMHPSAWE